MKKAILFIITIIVLLLIWKILLNYFLVKWELKFQNDADIARLEHLEYWTWIIEEYSNKTWEYPFQKSLKVEDNIWLVRISTKDQQQFFDKNSVNYNQQFDNNPTWFFQEYSVKEFVTELEWKLWRNIEEKYDIQKYPTKSPIWYNYFVTKNWYLFWVTCISCWITPISTLLYDWFTPTVNIGSSETINDVPKSLTRNEMINHHQFKLWKNKKYINEANVRKIEEENKNDSKNNIN